LNGNLQEEVYITPLPSVSHDSKYACKLKKALYGLKQALRTWFDKFSGVISSFEFVSSSHDSAFFFC
jgi:histone deacetylase 1/2